MLKEIKLKIVLQNPVEGVLYGLQKGKGSDYDTLQPQPGAGKDLNFEFAVQIKQSASQGISMSGPYVQGLAGSRFIYITIGSYAGQNAAPWSGRLKVPIAEDDFSTAVSEEDAACWSCFVPGSTAEGKPVFATVKAFGGWSKHNLSDCIGT
ncbi:DUF5990 family protein [Cnuella takakiae]|nr:DUF5990 family protein [Cnuella takakiae]OLY91481.1 hypothetical protein BUE76_05880 [Cnuella takakiae]